MAFLAVKGTLVTPAVEQNGADALDICATIVRSTARTNGGNPEPRLAKSASSIYE